jgi:membrane protease YdiL (CAAX protease family)
VAIGVGSLLLRLEVLPLPSNERQLALGVLYAATLAGALLVPVPRGLARMRPVVVLGAGVGAVVLATAIAGRPPAVPFTAWALPLSMIGALCEEALFRRVAYSWLERNGTVVAVVGSAVLFAAIHLPFYGLAALPVDLGAGLLFGWQRWASGTWMVPGATHAAANILAMMVR